MIIGIDASRANRPHKSGVEWYAYHIIKHLAKLDNGNEYILYADKPLTGDLADLNYRNHYQPGDKAPVFDKEGYQVLDSPHHNFRAKVLAWPFGFFWTQGRLSLEMIAHRPDVLFIPSHALPIIHPKKSVVTIHDIGFLINEKLYDKARIGPAAGLGKFMIDLIARISTFGKYSANTKDYLMWSTEYALKKSKAIITVSEFSRQEILQHFRKTKNNIHAVYNGFNHDFYHKITELPAIDGVLRKYGIERPYFFYVGRIDKKKNITALIEAFAIFKEDNKDKPHKLVLAGDASFGYDEVVYLIKQFQLDKDVIITGWLSESDLPALYSAAEAFVYPSKYEGFGIPVVQAMACGTPVLASDAASIPEIAQEGALLFPPDDPGRIACALKRIVEDGKLRQELATKAEARVKAFSWETAAGKILEIMKTL